MAIVLYVDNCETLLTEFTACCAEFEIIVATSAKQALDLLVEHEVALLISVVSLPHMSGVSLAQEVARVSPRTLRMLMVAESDKAVALEAMERGLVHTYVDAPWSGEFLSVRIRESLALHAALQRVAAMEQRLIEIERAYALGVVAAGIVHELRNPMSVLNAANEMIEMRIEDVSSRGRPRLCQDEDLEDLREQVALSNTAIEQMMEICQGVELGTRQTDRREVADAADVIDLTLRAARGTLKRIAAAEVDIRRDLPLVRGSRYQLGQIVLNLLVNAIEAFPEPKPENKVKISLFEQGNRAILEISDNGSGMAEAVLERAFDPFFTTKENSGTGLGLAISRRLVLELGGTISVESAVDRGTKFRVELPFASSGESSSRRT